MRHSPSFNDRASRQLGCPGGSGLVSQGSHGGLGLVARGGPDFDAHGGSGFNAVGNSDLEVSHVSSGFDARSGLGFDAHGGSGFDAHGGLGFDADGGSGFNAFENLDSTVDPGANSGFGIVTGGDVFQEEEKSYSSTFVSIIVTSRICNGHTGSLKSSMPHFVPVNLPSPNDVILKKQAWNSIINICFVTSEFSNTV